MKLVIAGLCSWFIVSGDAAINHHPGDYYVACRFDYDALAKQLGVKRGEVKVALKSAEVVVTNPTNGRRCSARIADWGPHSKTGRAADLSPALMRMLGLKTDQKVKVEIYIEKE